MKTYSIQHVLDWLETRGLLHKRPEAEAYLLSQPYRSIPLTLQLLMLAGAIIGSGCLIGFLIAAQLIDLDQHYRLMMIGILGVILALGLNHLKFFSIPLSTTFVLQSSFIFMLTGKILFLMGFVQLEIPYYVNELSRSSLIFPSRQFGILLSLGLFFSTLFVYPFYSLPIERFLSCFSLLFSLLMNVLFQFTSDSAFFLFYSLLLISVLFLFVWKNKTHHWVPLTYASACMLLLSTFFLPNVSPLDYFHLHLFQAQIKPVVYSLLVGASLLLIGLYLIRGTSTLRLPLLSAGAAIVLLSFFTSAGILLALGYLLIGYSRHEKALLILGAFFFIVFLTAFYYTLAMTLIHKSYILIASGAVLLASYQLIRYLHWDND